MRSVEERYRGKSVRVFRLDTEGVLRRLMTAAAAIVANCPDVVEIRLIGSIARGQAHPGSDADLVVTVSGDAAPAEDRTAALLPYLRDVGVGCDLLLYTTDEIEAMRRDGRRFPQVMDSEGIVLACR